VPVRAAEVGSVVRVCGLVDVVAPALVGPEVSSSVVPAAEESEVPVERGGEAAHEDSTRAEATAATVAATFRLTSPLCRQVHPGTSAGRP
jgi:hypothetical protein